MRMGCSAFAKSPLMKSAAVVLFSAFAVVAALYMHWAQVAPGSGRTQLPATVRIQISGASGAHDFNVFYAASGAQQVKGLMNYTFGCEIGDANCVVGELFDFGSELNSSVESAPQCFWMKNTPEPLTQAWIAKNGVVLEVYSATPESTASVCHEGYYVLELGARYGIGIVAGDHVSVIGAT